MIFACLAVLVITWALTLRHLERETKRHAAERHELYVRIQTPQLAPVYDQGEDDGKPLFVEFDNDEQYHDAQRNGR